MLIGVTELIFWTPEGKILFFPSGVKTVSLAGYSRNMITVMLETQS